MMDKCISYILPTLKFHCSEARMGRGALLRTLTRRHWLWLRSHKSQPWVSVAMTWPGVPQWSYEDKNNHYQPGWSMSILLYSSTLPWALDAVCEVIGQRNQDGFDDGDRMLSLLEACNHFAQLSDRFRRYVREDFQVVVPSAFHLIDFISVNVVGRHHNNPKHEANYILPCKIPCHDSSQGFG